MTVMTQHKPMQHAEAQSSLCVALGTLDSAGQVADVRCPFDIQSLLVRRMGVACASFRSCMTRRILFLQTAKSKISGSLGGKVAAAEDSGELIITDDALDKKVGRALKSLKQLPALDEDTELLLAEALVSLAPEIEEGKEDEALEPVHPVDLLTLLVAYMAENAGRRETEA